MVLAACDHRHDYADDSCWAVGAGCRQGTRTGDFRTTPVNADSITRIGSRQADSSAWLLCGAYRRPGGDWRYLVRCASCRKPVAVFCTVAAVYYLKPGARSADFDHRQNTEASPADYHDVDDL